ncbi:MAG: bifunctional tRNA (5-methylaminomethyl-2-thiouridine)(34)-methyltransferase MnmD/FAD-dependent 5-carboxymethylaminomethyl-2-thiouridine(34) oxidoreductase MnmC [Cellvibrionales bacterium]|jgi:tRNA 5-methylaminomethyl-2-thiouridine biosynthesis bifunctional protein|nr:bifunctional tRNA (5-methylaminomethyl-2-thiouridine)(34)-methyltransferase MnmD/FAD-dependent 5-carboxymethylaminomethyl-2-thiouridine(34) oxidoreductase MnmC [Cellvibrionales bacterium]
MSQTSHNQAICCTSSEQLIIDDNGGLRSSRFEDIYYTAGQGAEECEHVFLQGNNLQQRWQDRFTTGDGDDANTSIQNKISSTNDTFVIAETGFGTGLNFLACWDLWRKVHSKQDSNQAPKTLYFYTTELYPLTRAALEKSIAHYNPYPTLAKVLLSQYPDPIGGEYLLSFDSDTRHPVKLIVLLGDATECLSRLEYYPADHTIQNDNSTGSKLIVDAWLLDGYAPAKNPIMWQDALFTLIARHSADGTTVASFSVARQVCDQLRANSFVVKKTKGFKRKRDMLMAHFDSQLITEKTDPIANNRKRSRKNFSLSPCYYRYSSLALFTDKPRSALVIGAGIAGCTIAYKLAQRGWQVSLIDAEKTVAGAASGNARAVLYARTAQQRSHLADFHEAAFHYATRFYKTVTASNLTHGLNGMLKLDEQLSDEMLALNPEAYSRQNINAEQATELSGIATHHNGIHYPESGWIDPLAICQALTDHPNIRFYGETTITSLQHHESSWTAECNSGMTTNNNHSNNRSADIAIIATGQLSHQFEKTAWLPLRSMRGQTTTLPATSASSALKMAVCQRGYITPADNGSHSIGATYAIKDDNTTVLDTDHQINIDNVLIMLSEHSPWQQTLEKQRVDNLEGRVGFRCVAPDYLPIVGPIPAAEKFRQQFACLKKDAKQTPSQLAILEDGLYVSTGYGSHGYTTAPLASEILLAQIEGSPMPIGDKLRQSIAPARFLVRQLIRGT